MTKDQQSREQPGPIFTKEELAGMTRAELLETAEQLGLSTKKNESKKSLILKIINCYNIPINE